MGQTPDEAGRAVFDCLSALILLLTALLGAYLPRYLSHNGGAQSGTATSLAFHLGNMLSGGVMLSAGFCHLLADSLRQLAFIGRFPISTFLAAVGYLITLLADQLVQVITADDSSLPQTAAAGGGAGGPSAARSSSNRHGYMRIGKDDSGIAIMGESSAIALMGTQSSRLQNHPSLEHIELIGRQELTPLRAVSNGNSGLPILSSSNSNNLRSHDSSSLGSSTGGVYHSGNSLTYTPAVAAVAGDGTAWHESRTGPPPRLSLPDHLASPTAGAAAVSGLVAGNRSTVDDVAVCVFASGSPRSLTADRVAARPSSRAAQHPAAAAVHKEAAVVSKDVTPGKLGGCQCRSSVCNSSDLHSSSNLPSGSCNGDAMAGRSCQHSQPQQAVSAAAVWSLEQEEAGRSPLVLPHQQQRGIASDKVPCNAERICPSQLPETCLQQLQKQQQQRVVLANGGSTHLIRQQQEQQRPLLNGCTTSDYPGWQGTTSSSCIQDKQKLESNVGQPRQNGCCPSRQQQPQQQHGHSCCQHPEDMTDAHSIARVAEHLELCVGQAAGHPHAHFQVLLSHQPLSFATTVLLACALCIHSILEGIALGAQQSMESTRDIMLAIAAHKGLAAYALGASIVESKASRAKFWTVVCMFAVATPLGIGIGYAFSEIGHGSVSAAMSALASGTFLYVALNEVIPKELEHPDGHRLLKVGALLLGFGLMSLLAVWA